MITKAQQKILLFLSNTLFTPGEPVEIDQDEAKMFLMEASEQAVLPLVAGAISDASGYSKGQMSAVIAKNLGILYEHTELHELLTANNIPYVFFEGVCIRIVLSSPCVSHNGRCRFPGQPNRFIESR